MAIGTIGGDSQLFGAQVVTQTLNNMNGGGTGGMPMKAGSATGVSGSPDTFGAQVVSKTLDTMNSPMSGSGGGSDYDFQKSVLGAPVEAAKTIIDYIV